MVTRLAIVPNSQRLLRGIEFLSGSEVIFKLDKDDGRYFKNN